MARQGLSLRAYAAHRKALQLKGASKKAVTDAKARGWLVLHDDGSIAAEASDARWASMTRTRADVERDIGGAERRLESIDYQAERARLTKAQADLAELKHRLESGQLIEREEHDKRMFTAARVTRDLVMGVADRVADELAALTDARAVKVVLVRALRKALRELAREDGET